MVMPLSYEKWEAKEFEKRLKRGMKTEQVWLPFKKTYKSGAKTGMPVIDYIPKEYQMRRWRFLAIDYQTNKALVEFGDSYLEGIQKLKKVI